MGKAGARRPAPHNDRKDATMPAKQTELGKLLDGLVAADGRTARRISLLATDAPDAVRNIVSGRSKRPGDGTLKAIEDVLGAAPGTLAAARDGRRPPPSDPAADRARAPWPRRGRRPSLYQQALELHQQACPGQYGIVVKNAGYYPRLVELVSGEAAEPGKHKQRKISPKAAAEVKLDPVEGAAFPIVASPKLVKPKKRGQPTRLLFGDGGGAWRVRLGRTTVLHIVRAYVNSKVVHEYTVGTREALTELERLFALGVRKPRTTLPRKGVWQYHAATPFAPGYYTRYPLKADEVAHFRNNNVYGQVREDVDAFFGNIDLWTRYGQPGVRKLMMVGPPGTGKTSIGLALMDALSSDMPCVVAENDAFFEVVQQAAALKRRCLVFAEEVDTLYRGNVPSAVLNFLDGVSTPKNPLGSYVIFTTNYPRKIDERIMKRPGRIDKVLKVGTMIGADAAKVALHYLPEDARGQFTTKALAKVLTRATPAEIREIVMQAVRMTYGRPDVVLDADLLATARKELKKTLESAADWGDETPEDREEDWKRRSEMDSIVAEMEEDAPAPAA